MNQPGRALATFLEHPWTAGYGIALARIKGQSRQLQCAGAPFATTDMPGYVGLLELLWQRSLALRFDGVLRRKG